MRRRSHQSLDFGGEKWTLSPEMFHHPQQSPILAERVHFLILHPLQESPYFGKVHFPDASQSPILKEDNWTFSPRVSLLRLPLPSQSLDFGEKESNLSHAMFHHPQQSPILAERVHFLILHPLQESPYFGKVHFPDALM